VSALRRRDLFRWAQRAEVLAQIEVEEFKQPLAFLGVERSSPLAETVPDSHAEADDRARGEIGRRSSSPSAGSSRASIEVRHVLRASRATSLARNRSKA
jgi:hypothetical protein